MTVINHGQDCWHVAAQATGGTIRGAAIVAVLDDGSAERPVPAAEKVGGVCGTHAMPGVAGIA